MADLTEALLKEADGFHAQIPPGVWRTPAKFLIERLTTAIRQAEAEHQRLQEAQGWQPIETAPKDGRQIVVWGKFQSLSEYTRGTAYWDGVWITSPVDLHYNDRIIPEQWQAFPPAPAGVPRG